MLPQHQALDDGDGGTITSCSTNRYLSAVNQEEEEEEEAEEASWSRVIT